jgi:hypothetical protein
MVSEWEFSGGVLVGSDVVLYIGSLRGTGNSLGPGNATPEVLYGSSGLLTDWPNADQREAQH